MRNLIIGCGLVLGGLFIGVAVWRSAPRVSDEEIARRVAESHPVWANYPEDIKAQVGAGPVAEWAGAPESLIHESGYIRVTFTLSGPWAERKTAMPILLREPRGGVVRNEAADFEDGRVVYLFDIGTAATELKLPWVELQYPHAQKRLVLFEDGSWRDTGAP